MKIPPNLFISLYSGPRDYDFAVVPRMEIRRLSILAIIYGAITDFYNNFLNPPIRIGGHTNYHPFGFMGIPFFPLLAWVYFIIYIFTQKGP